jgi:hypothetical protein
LSSAPVTLLRCSLFLDSAAAVMDSSRSTSAKLDKERDLVYAGAAVAFLGCVEGGFWSLPVDGRESSRLACGLLLAQASETATLQMWGLDAPSSSIPSM